MTSGEEPAVVLNENVEQIAVIQSDLLSVMANKHRLHILFLLSEREYSIGDLTKELHETSAAISRHLTILREKGIIRARRCGQIVCYSLICHRAGQMVRTIAEIYRASEDEGPMQ